MPTVTPSQHTPSSSGAGGAPRTNDTSPEVLFSTTSTRGTPEINGGGGLIDAINAINKNTKNRDVMLGELTMQHTIFGEQEEKKRGTLVSRWMRKVLGSTSVVPMVGVKNGFLRVVHTIGEYQAEFGESCEYDENIIGFVGDRVGSNVPMPVKLTDKRIGWKLEKGTFKSEATLRTFYTDTANTNKFYVLGDGDATEDLYLPLLLQVPLGHVEWLLKTPRTPFQYHEKLLEDLGGEGDTRPGELSVSLLWLRRACMAAPAEKGGTNKSLKEMVLEPVLTDGYEHLKKWLEGRLETTLGPGPAGGKANPIVQNVNHYHGVQPDGHSPYVGQGSSSTGGLADQEHGTVSGGKSEKGALSVLQVAALKGWCQAVWDHELPMLWTELQSTNDVEDARSYFNTAWDESRKTLNLGQDECNDFFLEDQTVKDWKKCKFAPGGMIPVWEYLMKGMSILLCSNFTTEAQLKSQDRERAYQETPYTRTTQDAERRERKEPRHPPMVWSTLKYLINTYVAMLHALYTADCPHFKGTWAIREVMASMRNRQQYFTKQACALIVYHILKDARQFFSVRLMPRDFEGAVIGESRSKNEIAWPVTNLFEVAKHIHKLQMTALDVADLPEKWRYADKEKEKEKDTKRAAMDDGGREQGGPQQWRAQQSGGTGGGGYGGNAGYGGSNGGGYSGNSGGGSNNQGGGGGGTPHNVLAPQLRQQLGALVDECKRLNPNFGHAELKQFGGLEMWHLPQLNKYCRDGRNHACNGGLLGICRYTDSTCRFQRVDHRDIPNDFVDEFVKTAGPALEKCRDAMRQGRKAARPDGYRSRGGAGRKF